MVPTPEQNAHRVTTPFFSFLKTVPTPDDIVQALVMRFFALDGARAGLLGLFNDAGLIEVIGRFGDFETTSSGPIHVFDDHALARAVCVRGSSLDANVPPESDESFLAIPMVLAAKSLGAVSIRLAQESRDEAWEHDVLSRAEVVAEGLAIYFAGRSGISNHDQRETRRLGSTSLREDRADRGGELLTPRQKTILVLLAQELTNTQIAFQIGYSESTVRQETMTIFRKLGVSGRAEAVKVGRARGFFTPDAEVEVLT
jgi:DNA-binding CsgD family transcriptional regulator